MRQKTFCFDGTTPIIYKEKQDGVLVIESIKDAYEKHSDDEIYVCAHIFDEYQHLSKVTWVKAILCNAKSIKCVTIFFKPEEFGSSLESDNIVRVTPNHVFPILTKHGYKDIEAYLLQTGDKMIFERNRNYGEFETPLFDEEGDVPAEDILEEGSSHFIDYRHVMKVSEEEIEERDFYGIVLPENCESRYFMLCNSLISHDSTVY